MKFLKLSHLSKGQREELLKLWNKEYPEKLNYQTLQDLDNYLESLENQSHILITDENQKIMGWYVDFNRESKRWFAIILDSKVQSKGLGTKILNLVKEKETELNAWVIDHHNDKKKNGEPYKSPLLFYLKNGFEKMDQERLELDKISAVRIKWVKNYQ